MEDIIAVLIPIIGFVCLVVIIKAVLDSRLKRRLAETHASEELVRALTKADLDKRQHISLKWGILLVLTSIAFLLIEIFDLEAKDPGAFGILIGAIGLGLLVVHFLQRGER
ncbi:DUF6249 domain-containing protein [Lacimicrobium alkaliphilum]|uniref:DUF6249 domain-containing protein n=1 Tax=Lacimicrobium alkaliphilum TaxID=1526571 RepID=A0A0U3AQU4_9ALTE|nr:DUF6249 domain-containing protein [Lacimicrobium alkaliphilum]ALT00243.1 hypothetical protein AT746_19555 [Lacimicrobium alkaliphilum]